MQSVRNKNGKKKIRRAPGKNIHMLTERQFGFRNGKSCVRNLLRYSNKVTETMQEKRMGRQDICRLQKSLWLSPSWKINMKIGGQRRSTGEYTVTDEKLSKWKK